MLDIDKKQTFKFIAIVICIYLILVGFTFEYASLISHVVTLGWVCLCVLVYSKWKKRVNSIDIGLFNAVFFCLSTLASLVIISNLGANRYVDKNIEYAVCSYKNLKMEPPNSNLTNIDLVALSLYGSPVQDISPVALNSIFELGGNGTDLQRENVEKSIKGKVVVWKLQVYEVGRQKDGTFLIQTQMGVVDRRSELQQMVDGFNSLGKIITSGGAVPYDRYGNQNVGTFVNLTLRNDGDLDYLSRLQTGNWITIRGKISGVKLRHVIISEAILEHSTNTNLYTHAFEKRFEYEKALDLYKNRSCSYVWNSPKKLLNQNVKDDSRLININLLDNTKPIVDAAGSKMRYIENFGAHCSGENGSNKYKINLGVVEISKIDFFQKRLSINGVEQNLKINDLCPDIIAGDDVYEYLVFYAGDFGNACDGPFVIMSSSATDYKFYEINTCKGIDYIIKNKYIRFVGLDLKSKDPNLLLNK